MGNETREMIDYFFGYSLGKPVEEVRSEEHTSELQSQ